MGNSSNSNQTQKHNRFVSILLNIIFYSMLFLLIGIIVYPHTSFYYQKNYHSIITMRLNKQELAIEKGQFDKLFVYNINKRVTYKSTNFRVAQVYLNGKVYARRAGKAVIKAYVDDKVFKCKVTVVDINKRKMTLSIGKSKDLDIKGTWSNARWESKDKNIAKVNRNGKVVGINKGETTITGTYKGIKLSCKVTVIK